MSTADRLGQQGRVGIAAELVLDHLATRFGPLPESIVTRVNMADYVDFKRWFKAAMRAKDLNEVFAAPRRARFISTADRLRAESWVQGWAEILFLHMLSVRFGPLPEAVVARVDGRRVEDIKAWMSALASAESLDEVFGDR